MINHLMSLSNPMETYTHLYLFLRMAQFLVLFIKIVIINAITERVKNYVAQDNTQLKTQMLFFCIFVHIHQIYSFSRNIRVFVFSV